MTNFYLRANTSGSKGMDVEWFASDIIPDIGEGKSTNLILQVDAQSSVLVEVSLDSGATWGAVNNNTPVPVGFSQHNIFPKSGDLVNVRATLAVVLNSAYIIADTT